MEAAQSITRIWQWLPEGVWSSQSWRHKYLQGRLLASSPNVHEPGKHGPCHDNLLKKRLSLFWLQKKNVGLNKGQISEKEIVFGKSPPVRCFQNFARHVRLHGRTAERMDRWVDSCSVGSSLHLAALMNVWIMGHTFTNTWAEECGIIIIWLLKWIMHLNIFFHPLRSVSSSSMHQVRL